MTQFHSAMEEFNKALQEKNYVDAANHLERVRTDILRNFKLKPGMKPKREVIVLEFNKPSEQKQKIGGN